MSMLSPCLGFRSNELPVIYYFFLCWPGQAVHNAKTHQSNKIS